MKITTYSQEQNDNHNTTTHEDNKKDKTSCCKKNKNIIIITIISSIVLITAVVLLCVFLIKKKKDDEEKSENEFYIIGTYKAEKGIPLKLFNPSKIGLTDKNYIVEEITQNNNTRRLQQINITDGIYIPEKDEKIQIKITFDEALKTLDFMFEGCLSLIKINLSNLNSPNITNMIYTIQIVSN